MSVGIPLHRYSSPPKNQISFKYSIEHFDISLGRKYRDIFHDVIDRFISSTIAHVMHAIISKISSKISPTPQKRFISRDVMKSLLLSLGPARAVS